MKIKWLPPKLPTVTLTPKKLVIVCTALLLVLITVSIFAYVYHVKSQQSAAVADTATQSKKTGTENALTPSSDTATPATSTSDTTVSVTTSTQQAPSNPTVTPAQPKAERQRSAPITGPSTVYPTATFSVGRINSAYTYCVNGALHYMIGGVDIFSSVPTTQSFTWRLEVSDGTISDSGTNTMPDNKSYWTSFPSTPSYPSMIGSIENANDGDRARIVITSPNYAAGGWSDPVPTGSEASCQNG